MIAIYQKNPDVIFRKIADEFVLVPIRQKAVDLKSIYTLNEVGAFIWELIDGTMTSRQIQDKVVEEFEVDSARARPDAEEMLSQFEALGFISKLQ